MNRYYISGIMLVFVFSMCRYTSDVHSQDNNLINPNGKKVSTRFNIPGGYKRIVCPKGSFGEYLQNLPLKTDGSPVMLYNGTQKNRQDVHLAVIDLPIENKDLQQCADAVIRLNASYLYDAGKYDKIAYNFVSDGKPRYYQEYCKNNINKKTFDKYLNYIYSYANTVSLSNQLDKVPDFKSIQIGDVLIKTGNPYGHTVIVVDMAVDTLNGRKIFMIAQSYMPAQEIHILLNPLEESKSPWYSIPEGNVINTPEWLFYKENLRKFK